MAGIEGKQNVLILQREIGHVYDRADNFSRSVQDAGLRKDAGELAAILRQAMLKINLMKNKY